MANLVRYQQCGCFHFVTFSCYRRQPLLDTAKAYGVFEQEFEAVRRRYGFVVAGYVLMPEHVHLLVGEPVRSSLSIALQVLKQGTSRKVKAREEAQFWQRRGLPPFRKERGRMGHPECFRLRKGAPPAGNQLRGYLGHPPRRGGLPNTFRLYPESASSPHLFEMWGTQMIER